LPSGSGQAIDVWIVDAGFHFEKTAVDFVPIVNMFSYMQSGRLKCDATLTVRRGGQSRKTTVEHFVPKIDTSNLQSGEMIWKNAARECYPGLLAKVMGAIKEP
jgi:hypothetical protein